MVKYGENEISGRAIVDKGEDLNADGTQHKASNGAVFHVADINVAVPNENLPDETRWSGPMDMVDMSSENKRDKHEVFKGRIPAKTTSYPKKDGSIGYMTEYPAINDPNAFIRCTDVPVKTIENVLVLPSNNDGLDEKGNIKVAFIPTKKGIDHTPEGGRDNSANTYPMSANGGINEDASMKNIKTFSSIYLDSLEKKRYFVGFPNQKMIQTQTTATNSYDYVTLDVKTSDPKNPDNTISKSVNFSLNKVRKIDDKGIHTQSAIVSDFTDGDRKTATVTGYVDGKKDQKEQFRYEDVLNAYYAKVDELKKQKEANIKAAKQGELDDLRAKPSNKRVIDTPPSAAPTAPAATEKANELESPI